ncbi:MAG: hypothetical protein LBE55_05585 [Clostridiales bacterium]|jgi:hypothetical protein|nr:hypothetical protein [Clostridiales bacterium]
MGRSKAIASLIIGVISTIPLFGVPAFLMRFFFDFPSIRDFWIPLALYLYVVNPLLGIVGIGLSNRAKKDGYAGYEATVGYALSLIAFGGPLVIFLIVGLFPF